MPQKSRIVAVSSSRRSEKTIRTPRCKRHARQRAEKAKEKALEDLTAEFKVKRDNILRQVVHTQPELVASAAERIQSYMVRERLLEHGSAMEAYQKGGMVKAEIDGILAAEFCQEILAPVVAAYEAEKARILSRNF